jgi:hypothetical protein
LPAISSLPPARNAPTQSRATVSIDRAIAASATMASMTAALLRSSPAMKSFSRASSLRSRVS